MTPGLSHACPEEVSISASERRSHSGKSHSWEPSGPETHPPPVSRVTWDKGPVLTLFLVLPIRHLEIKCTEHRACTRPVGKTPGVVVLVTQRDGADAEAFLSAPGATGEGTRKKMLNRNIRMVSVGVAILLCCAFRTMTDTETAIRTFISRTWLMPLKDLEASRSTLPNFMHAPSSNPRRHRGLFESLRCASPSRASSGHCPAAGTYNGRRRELQSTQWLPR